MTQLKLSRKERTALEWLIGHAKDARAVCRAQAVLWASAGEHIDEIARRLLVTRQSVYNWLARYHERAALPPVERLSDAARAGRPRTAAGIIDPLIAEVIEHDPRDLDYQATIWTAPLLRAYLSEQHQISVSRKSVASAIARLKLRWKRPRHHLSLRPRTWRQAKGG
ncbi:MAG: helix-turn-helix domain-containing protein [Pyrinomonadaceae bacterium]